MSRRQLVDAAIDRVRRRHIAEAQIGGEGVAVECDRPRAIGAQRLQLGAEQEHPVELAPIERLDAEPVADEVEHPLAPVPQRHREHTEQPLDGRRHPPFGGTLDNDLGVAVAAEPAPDRFE